MLDCLLRFDDFNGSGSMEDPDFSFSFLRPEGVASGERVLRQSHSLRDVGLFRDWGLFTTDRGVLFDLVLLGELRRFPRLVNESMVMSDMTE